MTDKQYPLEDNWGYLDTLDMSRDYTDEEIRDIYDIVFNRNDPKHVEYIGNATEKLMLGNIFIAKPKMTEQQARNKTLAESDDDMYLSFIGEISEEEFRKRSFIKAFRKYLKK